MMTVIATLKQQSLEIIPCSTKRIIAKNGNLKFKHVFGKKRLKKMAARVEYFK